MADTIGLSDVSSEDTGKGKSLKTGNLKRSYNMPKEMCEKLKGKEKEMCHAYKGKYAKYKKSKKGK